MNQVGQYSSRDYQISRFYFTGTTKLQAGQALCFMQSPATTNTATQPRGFASAVKSFPFDVKIPDANNHGGATTPSVFAGIVAESSVGFVGPGYVDVIVPQAGDIIQVATGQNADIALADILMWGNVVGTNATTGGTIGLAYSGALGTVSSQLALSQLGAFAAYTFPVTSLADVSSANFIANVISGLKQAPLVQALESLASSTASTSARALVWVKFL